MFESGWSLPLWKALERMSDQELIGMLKYIRDENGERVNLFQLRRYLREKRGEHDGMDSTRSSVRNAKRKQR